MQAYPHGYAYKEKMHERPFNGFDERITTLYARGMSVREIQAFLADNDGTQVLPALFSSVTDEVIVEAISWQTRLWDVLSSIVFLIRWMKKYLEPTAVLSALSSMLRVRTTLPASGSMPRVSFLSPD